MCVCVCVFVCVCVGFPYYPQQDNDDDDICWWAHTHTHTHTHIYMYIYIYILVISRAENQRKHRKKKHQARRAFYSNPYAFTKKLFVESKSGKLDVPKEELENHLKMTYSDDLNSIPIPPLRDLPKTQYPTVMFDDNGIKLKEVLDIVHMARAGSAPGLNGISYKLYKSCPRVLRKLTVLLQQAWKKAIVPQKLCLADGIWIPKEMQSKGMTNFRPISLLNVEGKYFLEFLLVVWQPFWWAIIT